MGKKEFWRVTSSTLEPRLARKRWEVEFDFDAEIDTRKALGDIQFGDGPVSVPTLIADANRADRVEDAPEVFLGVFVVSDRLRALLEEVAPGDCQFTPIDIRFHGKSIGLSYWVMHVLKIIDCVDPERSVRVDDFEGHPSYFRATPDSSKVPPEVGIFRVQYAPGTYVRDSIRQKVMRSGVTGLDFYPP